MSAFFESLFNSIFTPGPTPTLVIATNAAFAALQLVFVLLLVGTRSIHFAILSVLCGGLWWAINWFVREVQALKAEEEHGKTSEKGSKLGQGTSSQKELRGGPLATQLGAVDTAADSEDTETEAEQLSRTTRSGSRRAAGEASTSGLRPQADDARKRTSAGDVSGTDSEWEKLSESEIRH